MTDFRHFRLIPDLDSPGPYAINLQTGPFRLMAISITGGPMSILIPTPRCLIPRIPDRHKLNLYFQRTSKTRFEGIIRIGILPSGDQRPVDGF